MSSTAADETGRPNGKRSAQTHLAVDLGGSSGRVIAGAVREGNLTLEPIHRFENRPIRSSGSMHWDVDGLWQEICRGLALAGQQEPDIGSIGVDSWGVDYVLLTADDRRAAPVYHYRDGRTAGIMDVAFKSVPRSEIFAATGLQFMELNTLFQLVAANQSEAGGLQSADGLLLIGDYFHWKLTGVRGVEVTNASTTQLLDPRTRTWRTDLIQRFHLPSPLFGDLVEPGTTLGELNAEAVAATGLGGVPVVIPATHDTASAVLSVPAPEFAPEKPSWCYISSGTWSLMGCELPGPIISDRCAELNFTNEVGVGGSIRLLKNIGGLWIFQQLRESMLRRGRERSWEEMVERANAAPAFGLLLDPDDPCFVAPQDMVDEIERYAERTGQPAPEDEGTLYRASLEGLALRYRVCLEMLESLVGRSLETIHIVGGGSLNETLCQMTADACDRSVVAGPVEATAIGNVLMQMIGTGAVASVPQARALVRESFDTQTYQPQNPSHWKSAVLKFGEL